MKKKLREKSGGRKVHRPNASAMKPGSRKKEAQANEGLHRGRCEKRKRSGEITGFAING